MKWNSLASLLLAYVTLLAFGEVNAQVRGEPATKLRNEAVDPANSRAAKLAELDDWLRRLQGHYRVSRDGRPVGLQDCVGIGDGPGVHCMIGPAPNSEIEAPTMILYGVDLDALEIRFLQVNARSHAEGDRGRLSGNTLNFPKVQCPTTIDRSIDLRGPGVMVFSCERRLRIYSPPDSNFVLIQTVTAQRIFFPTPRNGRRPRGDIGSRLFEYIDNVQLQRVPAGQTGEY